MPCVLFERSDLLLKKKNIKKETAVGIPPLPIKLDGDKCFSLLIHPSLHRSKVVHGVDHLPGWYSFVISAVFPLYARLDDYTSNAVASLVIARGFSAAAYMGLRLISLTLVTESSRAKAHPFYFFNFLNPLTLFLLPYRSQRGRS